MCRILLALGTIELQPLLEGMKIIAQNKNRGHEFNTNSYPWTHSDGWGIAFRENDCWKIQKSIQPIYEENTNNLNTIKTNHCVLHIRKALGSEIKNENTHPFLKDNIVFCHNGFIPEPITFSKTFQPQGQTDSEKLFYAILTIIKEHKTTPEQAIKLVLNQYTPKTGTNIIFSTPEETIIAVRATNYPQYYHMVIAETPTFIIISSEELPTYPDLPWQKIIPGQYVIINNNTRKYLLKNI